MACAVLDDYPCPRSRGTARTVELRRAANAPSDRGRKRAPRPEDVVSGDDDHPPCRSWMLRKVAYRGLQL